MNKTVYIIRHGEIENPENIVYGSNIEMELSDIGRSQLKRLGLKIQDSGLMPSEIISSPLKRAIESSQILANIWHVKIETDADLKDSFVPAVAGKPIHFLEELYKQGTDEYTGEFLEQGNESREHIADRILGVYKRGISKKNDCFALLSHGDPILFLLYRLENPGISQIPMVNRLQDTVEYLSKGHAWKLEVSKNGELLSKQLISPD